MKKSKAKSKPNKNAKAANPKPNHPDFGKYESFVVSHAPLTIGQMGDWFDKDSMDKSIQWMIFNDVVMPRTNNAENQSDLSFALIDFNSEPTDWEDNPPYARYRSRKFKAVRYERF